jgi:hypothetical protein
MSREWGCRRFLCSSISISIFLYISVQLVLLLPYGTTNSCNAFTLYSINNNCVKLDSRVKNYFSTNVADVVVSPIRRNKVAVKMSTLMDPLSSSSNQQAKPPQGRRPSKPSSFAQRMRSIIQRDSNHVDQSSPTCDMVATQSTKVKVVHTLDEFRSVLQVNKDKIVVVRWFASWCRVSIILLLFCYNRNCIVCVTR